VRLELRDYQVQALEQTEAAEARGVRRQLGVAATGLGKGVMLCALAERRGDRALILAHRDELVNQAATKVREVWPGVEVGIVKAQSNDVGAHVVIASVQTLTRSSRLTSLLAPFTGDQAHLDPFGLVVVDEAHHASAKSYRGILEALRAGDSERAPTSEEIDAGCELDVLPAGPLLLGVTATPDRGDGEGLDDLFDEITWNYDILWGIGAGYLCDLRGLRVMVSALDLNRVKVSRGDYEVGAAGEAMEKANAPQEIVKAWLAHARDRRTLVFTPTVATAESVAEEFRASGVATEWVHGGTPMDERHQMLKAFETGECQVMVNCMVLTEGYDNPRIDCIIVARPTKSRALFTQMAGRGTRRHPDKTDCLVLDVVGASYIHSLVTLPSLFGLEGKYADQLTDLSGSAAEIVNEAQEALIRNGRLWAEEAELFHEAHSASYSSGKQGIAWVAIHRDEERPRYICSLGKHLPKVVLTQRDDGWLAGVQEPDKTKRVLIRNVTLEVAQGVGEDFVRSNAVNIHLHRAGAAWRQKPPTVKQLEAAQKWRLVVYPEWTAGDLSDQLTAHIERKKARHPSRGKG
jgi:ATP-dependent helicase IRC3